jgi:Flp pilus assembly secretin CpaC
MNKKLAALALSFWLCSGPMLPAAVMAAAPSGPVPMLKTAITNSTTAVELTLGKAQIVHLNMPASRISISDPEVVGMVLISPTEIELIGKSIGVANLLVWSEGTGQNYLTIDLSVHRDVSTLANKIQMIDPGINILPVAAEDSVILTGMAESIDKAQLAFDLAKAFFAGDDKGGGNSETSSNSPGSSSLGASSTKILNLIRIAGQPTTKAEMVQQQLKLIDKGIKLEVVPGFGGKEKAILTGRVHNTSMVSKAVNLTSVFYGTPGIKILTGPGGNLVKDGKEADGGTFESGSAGGGLIGNLSGNVLHGSVITDTSGNVVSMLEVEERPQIKCSIKILEVRKSNEIDLAGTTLLDSNKVKSTSYAGTMAQSTPGLLVDQITGALAGRVGIRWGGDMSTLLSGLITTGNARVLSEPTITSISGEPASFLTGGEFPIPLIGTNGGVSVIFKEFGVRLNILATATERGTIHMQISPEVSSLDPQAGININGLVIPGLRTRRSQTVLELKNGQDFVLSGLFSQDTTNTYTKTPILGQIPILGALFRSQEFQNNKTELVIVVHPEVLSDMNLSNLESSQKVASAPTAEVREVVTLDPKETFKEFGMKPEVLSKLNLQPSSETMATPKTTAVSPSQMIRDTMADQTLSNKEKLQALKKAEKETLKQARQARKELSSKADKVVEAQPKANAVQMVEPVASSKATDGQLMMMQAGEAKSTEGTKLESYLNSAKSQISDLLNRLSQPEPQPDLPEPGEVQKPAKSVAVPLPPAPVVATKPVALPVNPKKLKPILLPEDVVVKKTDSSAKKPVVTVTAKKPVSPKPSAAEAPATKLPKPFKTRNLMAHHMEQMQKQFKQFLSLEGF